MNAEFYCGMCGVDATGEKGDTLYCEVCSDNSNGSMKVKMKEVEDAK